MLPQMEWMNYHHLLYFWVVAREGSITRATAVLNLTQPTISAQLQALEGSLGGKLFERSGRRLVLTEMGTLVYRYAEDIFTLGRELRDVVRGRPASKLPKLVVGVADGVPNLILFRLLHPAFRLPQPAEVILREDEPSRLLTQLAMHDIDMVISGSPVAAGAGVKAYNHLLGESTISVFGSAEHAKIFRKGFPKSLDKAPMLLPPAGSESRRNLNLFFEQIDVRPAVVAELDDSTLMKLFGAAGAGIFTAPTAISKEITSQHNVVPIGTIDAIRERYYVISPERKIKHPAVAAIAESGRKLFE